MALYRPRRYRLQPRNIRELHVKLIQLKASKSPFPKKVRESVTTWVKPQLVAEVKFTEWTSSGEMRHPVYLDLPEDKRADGVMLERKKPHKANAVGNMLPVSSRRTAQLCLMLES